MERDMDQIKVVEWVDIDAPRDEVFQLLLDVQRRIQLSPLWDLARIDSIADDYPQVGSRYHVHLIKGSELAYDTVMTGYQEGSRISYITDLDISSSITWVVQDVPHGTRVIYEEIYPEQMVASADMQAQVRSTIHQWLENIKRYLELREGRLNRFIRFLLDRYYLQMRSDQRKTVQVILFMHAVGMISFVMAAIAFGIARFFI